MKQQPNRQQVIKTSYSTTQNSDLLIMPPGIQIRIRV